MVREIYDHRLDHHVARQAVQGFDEDRANTVGKDRPNHAVELRPVRFRARERVAEGVHNRKAIFGGEIGNRLLLPLKTVAFDLSIARNPQMREHRNFIFARHCPFISRKSCDGVCEDGWGQLRHIRELAAEAAEAAESGRTARGVAENAAANGHAVEANRLMRLFEAFVEPGSSAGARSAGLTVELPAGARLVVESPTI
jgi:hypothetical protein